MAGIFSPVKKMASISALSLLLWLLSISLIKQDDALKDAATRIGSLYVQRTKALDSFLQAYPRYFYDSAYAVREHKYEQLCYYFKQATCFLSYFEPQLYTNDLVGPFHFSKNTKKGFFRGITEAWLFQGPIGNESDSVLLKEYSKQDSLDQIDFIITATASYRDVLRRSHYDDHITGISLPILFDALRKELFRISVIDLANSDFIIDQAALPSLAGSMDSWCSYTAELAKALPASANNLALQFTHLSNGARQFLASVQDEQTFDRMLFTRQYLIPLGQTLTQMQVALQVPFDGQPAAIRPDAASLYEKGVFNIDYFAPDSNGSYSPEKAALGELLFFDPILSDNNRRACASCHKPNKAFTDGNTKSVSFGFGELPRNSPTVINAGFQKKLFWDLRAASLEDQLDSVVNSTEEMHSSFRGVIAKINASPEYIAAFQKAFPGTRTTGITREHVKYAIAVYERTLTGLNSRFDQYMQGNDETLSREEINGFNVFMGKAKCGTCHFAPLFNGSIPPFFDISDHHALGVPVRDTMTKYKIDPDPGLMKINGEPYEQFSFKVPTVRNAAFTAPYMHNGVYRTLEQVVDFYDKAAGMQFIRDMRPDVTDIPFFTILPIGLKLTSAEKTDLIAFIRALTDTSAAASVPRHLPAFEAPFAKLNTRTIGGDY
jgi:cytochrome c peroxidase